MGSIPPDRGVVNIDGAVNIDGVVNMDVVVTIVVFVNIDFVVSIVAACLVCVRSCWGSNLADAGDVRMMGAMT